MQHEIEGLVDDFAGGRLSRRNLVRHLVAFAALVGAGGAAGRAGAAESPPTFEAKGIDHVALRVTDVARSRDFYREHLGLQPTSCSASQCFLDCGPDFLALFRGETPGLDHYSFAIDGYDPGRAVDTLRAAGLSPDRRGNRVYFPDPDGIEVQVSRG